MTTKFPPYFSYQNRRNKVFQSSCLFGLLENTVTKCLFQFLEFNLQDCFHVCVFHLAWPMLTSGMSYLLYWSVSGLWLWSQLVF